MVSEVGCRAINSHLMPDMQETAAKALEDALR
jgi:hypothetical protein